MAIKKNFGSASIRKPGAYSRSTVDKSGGADLGTNDTIFILGEADRGAPGAQEGIKEYSSSQMGALIAEYGSGPIVDVALAAVNPSKTPGVGGAGNIKVWKTNASTRSTKALVNSSAATLLTLTSRNWGLDTTKISVEVEAGTVSADARIVTLRQGTVEEVLEENPRTVQLTINYTGAGSAATATISGANRDQQTLTTTCTGAGADDLSLALKDYTMKELVGAINATGKYTAVLSDTAKGSVTNASELDPVTAVDIDGVNTSFYREQKELEDLINDNSTLVTAELTANVTGQIAASSEAFLTGGARGASANSDFSTGLTKSLAEDYAVCVPAISRDAADDITDGLTDGSSAYTISSVLAAVSSHMTLRGKIKNRKEAQAICGQYSATKATLYASARATASANVQLAVLDAQVLGVDGSLSWKKPHVYAALCAGIRLGTPVGEPLTHKLLNANAVGHAVNTTTGLSGGDFNPDTDYDEAIDAGILFSEVVNGANRIVVDNTTYGADGSFVWNRGSVVEASYYVAKTLRETAEQVFVGNKVSSGLASSMKEIIKGKLRELLDEEIITASDDAPLGYVEDSFVVEISGNTARVELEFKPVQGLDFVTFDFTLGNITQSA